MKHTVRLLDKYAILVCLLAGLLAGALAIVGARTIALSLAHARLDHYTTTLLARAESIARETDNALPKPTMSKETLAGRVTSSI
jgi:hypothetical protein